MYRATARTDSGVGFDIGRADFTNSAPTELYKYNTKQYEIVYLVYGFMGHHI
jgi:hypothetical protein